MTPWYHRPDNLVSLLSLGRLEIQEILRGFLCTVISLTPEDLTPCVYLACNQVGLLLTIPLTVPLTVVDSPAAAVALVVHVAGVALVPVYLPAAACQRVSPTGLKNRVPSLVQDGEMCRFLGSSR